MIFHWPLRERLGEVSLLFGVLTVGPPRAPENSLSIEESPLAASKKEKHTKDFLLEQHVHLKRRVYFQIKCRLVLPDI